MGGQNYFIKNNLFVGIPKFNLNENAKKKVSDQFRNNEFKETDLWIWKCTSNHNWGGNEEIRDNVATGKSSDDYVEITNIIDGTLEVHTSLSF